MRIGNYSQSTISQSRVRLSFFSNFFSVFVFSSALILGVFNPSSNGAFGNDTHLYFITSEGCAPCRQVEPAIEALQREGYPVTTVQYGQHEGWARKLGVDRTPTVVMITENKMVGRHAGIIDAVTLKKWFAHQGINAGKTFASAG
jgi:thiol-disulfide isomerase/thioredoxin